jgi:hypothetical protein
MASSAARLIVGCLASPDRAVNCIREGFQFGVHDRGHSGHGLLRPRRKARHGASLVPTGGPAVNRPGVLRNSTQAPSRLGTRN